MPQGKGTYGSQKGRPPKAMKGMKVLKKGGKVNSVKGVSTKGLTDRQSETLKKHSVHHTSKHIRVMVEAMRNGSTFTQSHNKAQKSVGK